MVYSAKIGLLHSGTLCIYSNLHMIELDCIGGGFVRSRPSLKDYGQLVVLEEEHSCSCK